MPANVESMMSVREMPWHKKGEVLADYPGSWEEARRHAGLAWDPVAEPVYALAGVSGDGDPLYEPVAGWKRVTRSDTGATLAVRPDTYQVVTNTDMGPVVEAVLAQPNVKWETAGCLEGGRSVWCLAALDEPVTLPGDDATVTMPYLAVTTRHDGQGACALRATAVRIVCANTFRAAELEGERHGATYAFTHRGNWRDHLDDARDAVTGARREMAAYADIAGELLKIRVTPRQRELFVREFIPMPPDGIVSDRVARNVEEARKAVRDILTSPTTAEVAHTAYGLVQAGGEYLDHVRRANSWETKLGRTLLRAEPLKHRALTLAREAALA